MKSINSAFSFGSVKSNILYHTSKSSSDEPYRKWSIKYMTFFLNWKNSSTKLRIRKDFFVGCGMTLQDVAGVAAPVGTHSSCIRESELNLSTAST